VESTPLDADLVDWVTKGAAHMERAGDLAEGCEAARAPWMLQREQQSMGDASRLRNVVAPLHEAAPLRMRS